MGPARPRLSTLGVVEEELRGRAWRGTAFGTLVVAVTELAYAFIDHEVAYHQQVLDAVDKTLMPSAQNAELKSLLVSVRPAFVAHLEHAKNLQASLGKKS